jgi:hypothetical protein
VLLPRCGDREGSLNPTDYPTITRTKASHLHRAGFSVEEVAEIRPEPKNSIGMNLRLHRVVLDGRTCRHGGSRSVSTVFFQRRCEESVWPLTAVFESERSQYVRNGVVLQVLNIQ